MRGTPCQFPAQYRLIVGSKSRRGIPEAPGACVLTLPYGSTMQSTPHPISNDILWTLQSTTTRERGDGMRQRKQQTWVPVSEQGGGGRVGGDW